MSEEIKDLLETLVLMERNNLDHLIRTGQAIKWRKSIEQLQQENKELKEALENKRVCYYNNKAYDIKVLLSKNNILTEFEKWLEEYKNEVGIDESITIQMILDKLQNMKEGKK